MEIPREYNAAVDLIDRNLSAGRGGKIAYIDDSGSCTYAQLAERVDRAASALRALGIKREQRVCDRDARHGRLGRRCSSARSRPASCRWPLNTLLTPADYEYMLTDSRARALVRLGAAAQAVRRHPGEMPDLSMSSCPIRS